ncbi:MAG: D-alanyl-D-alanine carboxypeptidase/D-alanyl-D-alanine-endopeptidase [Bryobacteraceae bacterium]
MPSSVQSRYMRLWAILLLPAPLCGQPLRNRIEAAIASTTESRQAHWGIRIVDLATGKVIYSVNENRFFTPASNAKLFSTGLALTRLGPDHRFVTKVVANVLPDAEGQVGELRIVGGGDPNLSGRVLPYSREAEPGNSLEAIEALADSVVARGVKRVLRDVIGDDTAYIWEPYPDGWAVDDTTWEYGAPVSALIVNDNAFRLTLTPSSELGGPAEIAISPEFESLVIHNRTRTTEAETNVAIERLPGSGELLVSGPVAKKDVSLLAVDDPALVAANLLRDALLKRGVSIPNGARALHRTNPAVPAEAAGVTLAERTSLPLIEDLRIVNKESQNLHAEIALREVARVANGVGSRKGGLVELQKWLEEISIGKNEYAIYDGSGLSRLTLITPLAISKLLIHMYATAHREAWLSTLPVGGVDGTLYRRFDQRPKASQILAKTGTLSHVSTLAGYALRKKGGIYAFSIMVDHFTGESRQARKAIDRIALALVN